jgi:phosphoribulokinase
MGKPVDVLEIDGHATSEQVRELEKVMCNSLPSFWNFCNIDGSAELGKVVGTTGEILQSHPLAITQLLTVYHMIQPTQLYQ